MYTWTKTCAFKASNEHVRDIIPVAGELTVRLQNKHP